jgi:uncharacterized protein
MMNIAKVTNATRGTIIAEQGKDLRDVNEQAQGLMFTKRRQEFCLLFTFARPRKEIIHMLFVFYPIDIIVLNERREVVALKERCLPFTFYAPKPRMSYLIEIPAGRIKATGTTIGDSLAW